MVYVHTYVHVLVITSRWSLVQKGIERKQLLIAIIVMVSIKSSYYVLTEDAKVFHCLKLLYSFQCKIGKISVS